MYKTYPNSIETILKLQEANMQVLVRSPYSRYSEAMKEHAAKMEKHAAMLKKEAQRAKQH